MSKKRDDGTDEPVKEPESEPKPHGHAKAAAKEDTPAQIEAKKQHPSVTVTEKDGLLVYSVAGSGKEDAPLELLTRDPLTPGRYTLLVDSPAHEYKAGDVKILTEPHDHQCACTARDLAVALGHPLPEEKK